jgi:hypothetical protein
MPYSTELSPEAVQQWMQQRPDMHTLREQLLHSGHPEELVNEHLLLYRKLIAQKKQFAGFVALGIGAFLGFISCLLSVLNPVPELYYWILYGLTSVALCIIFLGLYWMFES